MDGYYFVYNNESYQITDSLDEALWYCTEYDMIMGGFSETRKGILEIKQEIEMKLLTEEEEPE